FGYERSYLYRIFKNHLGVGIKEYIIKTRMEHAQILLKQGYSVNKTSLAVGYKDQTNFSKAYKKHFGVPPKKI
ncbi:MAG: helix-turn-helix transcriptional regulator, partial [Clostridiales bacterium]|nr:helix-turn-helix transcriptional regulator [Clostridiales bacterium]